MLHLKISYLYSLDARGTISVAPIVLSWFERQTTGLYVLLRRPAGPGEEPAGQLTNPRGSAWGVSSAVFFRFIVSRMRARSVLRVVTPRGIVSAISETAFLDAMRHMTS